MNEFRRLKLGTQFDNEMIADLAGVDVAVVNLFERKLGFTDYNTVMTICGILDVSFFDMFPGLCHLKTVETDDEDEAEDMTLELFADDDNRALLIAHLLDPDIRPWFAQVHLKSGNQRRYKLTSLEKSALEIALTNATDSEGYFVFHADCQFVIVKRSDLADIRFTNSLSYAPFSSEERGLAMTLISKAFPRPVETGVSPDDTSEDGHGRPLGAMIDSARETGKLPAFIRLAEEGDTRFIGVDEVEVIEIPVGLTIEGFYDDDEPEDSEIAPPLDLSTVEIAGSA